MKEQSASEGSLETRKLHSWRNAPVSFLAMRRREISQELQDMDEKASYDINKCKITYVLYVVDHIKYVFYHVFIFVVKS